MVADLIARLHESGARLTTDGSRLEVDAPDDVLTDDVITQLARHKAEIIAALSDPATLPTATSIIALWNELGRPWVVDRLGGEIRDLPHWLEGHTDPEEWESPLWALSIWTKQKAKGWGTQRSWARSSYLLDTEESGEEVNQ
jgi:hypothetical protein